MGGLEQRLHFNTSGAQKRRAVTRRSSEMSLVVDKIACIEESDEPGSDDIYLVVFRGFAAAPFDSNLVSIGPGSTWDDFDTGEVRGTDVGIAKTRPDAVYAVMMVEEDNGKDISGDVVNFWKSQTNLTWKATMLGLAVAGQQTTSENAKLAGYLAVKNTMKGLVSISMEFPKGNDDLISVRRVHIVTPGQSEKLRFRSDEEDATYDVTFKQVA